MCDPSRRIHGRYYSWYSTPIVESHQNSVPNTLQSGVTRLDNGRSPKAGTLAVRNAISCTDSISREWDLREFEGHIMSKLKTQLQSALKDAMRAKDSERRNAIRLLNSAIKQVEIDTRIALDDDGVQAVLQKEAKKHRETIAELESADRDDEAASVRYELGLIESLLPSRLADDELRQMVQRAIDDTGASSTKETGQIMQVVMPLVRGRADGKQVNSLVKEMLS